MFPVLSIVKPHYIAPGVVFIFLAILMTMYWWRYRRPAGKLQQLIRSVTQQVSDIRTTAIAGQREALRAVFDKTPLEHSWSEFAETLHDQHETIDRELHLARIRATASSSYFFSHQKIIETPLRTEYFKHLPGILTGIGIIGTFAGLMLGLSHFDASDPATVQESVATLLKDVRYAFAGSLCAIVAAMIITHSEKEQLRRCLAALEKLTDAIDRIFDAGVSEEYLALLVQHTQESSVQTRMLKDSLVTDLREMLTNLVESQVRENIKLADVLSASYKESGQNMAQDISAAIETSLRGPLDQIAHSVSLAAGDQSGKVQTLLQDVLVAFMAKLESTFGNQFTGMQDMLKQSITSMQQMHDMFASLVQDMRLAGESSGQAAQEQLSRTLADLHASQSAMQSAMNDMIAGLQGAVESIGSQGAQAGGRMGEQIERIFAESEARQQSMASQMQAFVDSLRDSVGKGQEDTMQAISESVNQLGSQLQTVMADFESKRNAMDDASEKTLVAQQEKMSLALGRMNDSQSLMQASMNEMMTGLQHAVTSIGDQGAQAGALMGKEMERQHIASAERQEALSAQFDSFLHGVQENVAQGQNDAMRSISATVGELGERLRDVIGTFEKNRQTMDAGSHAAQQQVQVATRAIVDELSAQVKALLLSLNQGHEATRETIRQLGDQTERTMAGMQLGADKINAAAGQFSEAGQGIAIITNSTVTLAGQLQGSAGALSTASGELSKVVADYGVQRDGMHQSIAIIESMVANAQSESGLRGQVLQDLKLMSERMHDMNAEARGYLEQVTEVLGRSFDGFGNGLEKSLARALGSFDAELDKAIKALGGGVQDLSENLDTLSDMVEKSTRLHRVS